MKPIYLSGFMGCGKSYLGRKAASETGLYFIDLDEYITEREGIKVSEIFKKYGEKFFRSLEFDALSEISADIIALGGGALTNPDTAAYVKENAVVIYINTPFENVYERIKGDKSRPLAVNKSKEELFTLYQSRESGYKNTADYIKNDFDEIINLIKELTEEDLKDKSFGKERL
ncbi:MAG: shikimate kinase [Oscillospiraceae bacterium]|nr:shikimate kinase [Oscillospiraceae bacterium]